MEYLCLWARIRLTLGCLCRAQTALKAEGFPDLLSLDLWEVYIKGECKAFMWPISRGGDHPEVTGSRDSCGITTVANSFAPGAGKRQCCPCLTAVVRLAPGTACKQMLSLCWKEAGGGVQSPLASDSGWET